MANQLFIGRIPLGCRARDVEDIFFRYGKMTRCDVKQGMKMAYGFVEYEDRRDAEDALRNEHGRDFMGSRIVVEWSRGGRGEHGGRGDRDYKRDDGYHGRPKDSYRGKRSRSQERYSPDYNRGRSPDYYPERRSPDYVAKRSPDYGRRSPDYGRRSPDYRKRSPDYRDRRNRRSRSRSRDRY